MLIFLFKQKSYNMKKIRNVDTYFDYKKRVIAILMQRILYAIIKG